MKRDFWAQFLTVVCVLLTIQCLPASSKNQIFKAYQWSPVSWDYTENITATNKGKDVQLRCTVSDAVTPQSLIIRRLDQDIQFPNKTYDRSTHSLKVTLTNVQCSEQGTYVCERREQKEMLDLAITDCGPKLCRNETNPKVVYAEINKPTTFSLCIVMEAINNLLYINDNKVREYETISKWSWKSTYKDFDNFRQYLNFTVRNVSMEDYRTYDITLTSLTSQISQGIKMEEKFCIELKAPESNPTLSFSVKSLNFKRSSWVKDAQIFPREDVRLECTTTELSQVNELHITRADGFPLSENHTVDIQHQSLVVILKSVECSQMGTYVCENGRGDKKMVDLGIYECPPQPCKDQSSDITLYARVNNTKQFSMCVQGFPDVSSLFFFNGIERRYNKTNELPEVYCTQSKLEKLFSTYNIVCTITVGGEINYRVHNFSILNGVAQNQRASFAVQIRKPVNPECPTDIKLTNQHTDSVTLSWQPGAPGADSQLFHVYYTCLSCGPWKADRTGVGENSVTISNLIQYKQYIVMLEPYNSENLINTPCQVFDFSTVVTTVTAATPTPAPTTFITSTHAVTTTETKKDNKSTSLCEERVTVSVIITILSVLTTLAVIMAVLRVFFKCRLKRRHSLPWNSRRTTLSQRNGRHLPGTTQEMSLMNNGNGSHAQYQNVRGEQIYQTVF